MKNCWLVPGLKEQGWGEDSAKREAKGRNTEHRSALGGGELGTECPLVDGPTYGSKSPAAGKETLPRIPAREI